MAERPPLVVLGVDPGTLVTGYAVVARGAKGAERLVAAGTIRNQSSQPIAGRLRRIFDGLAAVIAKHRPDAFASESAFYGKNAQSALKLGQARGVSMLAAALADLPVTEYAPREVKQSVVGNGAATKQQVQYMVRSILQIDDRPLPLDASDAIAVAVCHLHRCKTAAHRSRSWKEFAAAHPERVVS